MNKKKFEKQAEALYTDIRSFLDNAFELIYQIEQPQKVVVPKFVAEYIERCKQSGWHLQKVLSRLDDDEKVGDWAYDENDDLISEKVDMVARAWLDGYEVEKERLYVVTDGNKLYLKEFDELNAVIIIDDVVGSTDSAKRYSGKTEAQKAADELGWIVKEVEDER
ncbi:DUF1642 domain-containing protein [Streptococcus suis]|uniref:DUF1642 domain-containing protein n=1 Tax=Streptococcus suis TaxID=1307 RepID=UPI001961ABED|nr:DUF1642 domain-containing protein [Streptococcus suis]MBM7191202.1 DUF1642 domain-containing protein [Streptococcus suis]MCO8223450.1 DUF1642 domain-containing protein [Streptococcus suis]MCO8232329.1 DUF1642 domain-containing protein [Streptococcus suis]HEM3484931.1 DUF1642 domain-containing protein [Streptococcus suis]HEM3541867.1 DUF1642 domain-containing protein [Streptococcus suis]